MSAAALGNLIIESGIAISEIYDFKLESRKNIHALAWITGSVPEDIGVSPVFQKLEGSSFAVSEVSNDSVSQIFFGTIHSLKIWQEGNSYIVKVEVISSTEQLDRVKKSRTFQNPDMTYKELVRTVLSNSPTAQVIFNIEDRNIGRPIYQYKETDWEFLKRIASHLGTSLISVGVSSKPELYFGIPQGKKQDSSKGRIERIWFDKAYYKFCKEPYHFKKEHFICYDMVSHEAWKPGDIINLPDLVNGKIQAVLGRIEKGLLTYRYIIAAPEAFCTARYENSLLSGVSFYGTVLETFQESIRVWFDMDSNQSVGEAFWYPWMPETGNMMYCMPEIGERIAVTLDDDQGNARAFRSLRTNGRGNYEMQEPSKRYFTTAADKRMYLKPESLGFVDLKQKVPLRMELNDLSGINIESNCGIDLLAKEGVWLNAGCISFQAPQEISIIRRDMTNPTVINMCNGFDSVGKFGTVKMAGSGGSDFPVLESDSDGYEIDGVEDAIISSTPCAAGSTELERKVNGTKVDRVTAG